MSISVEELKDLQHKIRIFQDVVCGKRPQCELRELLLSAPLNPLLDIRVNWLWLAVEDIHIELCKDVTRDGGGLSTFTFPSLREASPNAAAQIEQACGLEMEGGEAADTSEKIAS